MDSDVSETEGDKEYVHVEKWMDLDLQDKPLKLDAKRRDLGLEDIGKSVTDSQFYCAVCF